MKVEDKPKKQAFVYQLWFLKDFETLGDEADIVTHKTGLQQWLTDYYERQGAPKGQLVCRQISPLKSPILNQVIPHVSKRGKWSFGLRPAGSVFGESGGIFQVVFWVPCIHHEWGPWADGIGASFRVCEVCGASGRPKTKVSEEGCAEFIITPVECGICGWPTDTTTGVCSLCARRCQVQVPVEGRLEEPSSEAKTDTGVIRFVVDKDEQ